jgi:hypothetical protein
MVFLHGRGHKVNCILEVSVIASEWEVHGTLHYFDLIGKGSSQC